MNIKFYSPEKTMSLVLIPHEDHELYYEAYGNMTDTFVANMHGWLFGTKGKNISISIEEGGKVLSRPLNLNYLIKKYGLIGFEDFPHSDWMRRYIIYLLHELTSIYLYHINKYRWWIDKRRVFNIEDGHELVQGSKGWELIRENEDRNIFKTVMIGRTLQEHFKRLGYPPIDGTVRFIYTSYEDGELNEN